MEIQLKNISKRFGRQWIFRGLSQTIENKSSWAVCGRNGSGKSTLLKIISGYSTATQGSLSYLINGQPVSPEDHVDKIGYAAPYQNLLEELSLKEHLEFHFQFKSPTLPLQEIIDRAGLSGAENKFIGDFSSGMKQRLKLAMALFSENALIFLDEPTANLDEQGANWYIQEMKKIKGQCTIIIASNLRYEYDFTDHQLTVTDFLRAN